MSQSDFCLGCLCSKDDNYIHNFNIQNGTLKDFIQLRSVTLCSMCRRVAQHAQHFVKCVQSNQLFLNNIHELTKESVESAKKEVKPLVNLSFKSVDTIQLNMFHENTDENAKELFAVVYGYGQRREAKVKVEVVEPLELKEEVTELLEHLKGTLSDEDCDFNGSFLKEEESIDRFLLKEDNLEFTNANSVRKIKRKTNIKQEVDQEINSVCNIETFIISREQCLEERAKMAQEENFINSPYKCEDCVKGFKFKHCYEKHLLKHSASAGEYECEVCRQRMSSEQKLIRHRRCHQMRYWCGECGLRRGGPRRHRCAHAVPKLSCPHARCGKVFRGAVHLRRHVSYAHAHARLRVCCATCARTYATKGALLSHIIAKHPEEIGARLPVHSCDDCGAGFRAPSLLRNHALKHSRRKDHYCVECDKSFKSAAILKHHLKTAAPHVVYNDLPLSCSECEKRFGIRRDLQRHMNRVHLNVRPHRCPVDDCDKAYVNEWSLSEHRRLAHEGFRRPRRFACPHCDKLFDRNQILVTHIRTHTGERPFACARCGARFAQRGVLATHNRLVHLRLTRDGRPKNAHTTTHTYTHTNTHNNSLST